MTHDTPDRTEIEIKVIELPYAHHSGAWKVAYADFVTAMMAFFLLMWLLNVTTKEQKNALSDYFNPSHPQVSATTSGAGGVLGGLTMSPEGARASDKNPLVPMQVNDQRKRGGDYKSKVNQVNKAREKAEQKRFEKAAEKIKQAVMENPDLKNLKDNITVTVTPEGLRIEILDQENESMFPSGSANMFEKTRELISQIAGIILDMPNELSVRGHTDGARYSAGAKYTNWELSADRANAVRRVILESGFPIDRLNNVMGKADTALLIKDNPLDPRNRRITLILLKEELTNPEAFEEAEEEENMQEEPEEETLNKGEITVPVNPYRKTPGAIEFP